MGFPVAFQGGELGDFSWLPRAIINPGVRIGRNCVFAVKPLVTSNIPDGPSRPAHRRKSFGRGRIHAQ
jgi:hypothetical protein